MTGLAATPRPKARKYASTTTSIPSNFAVTPVNLATLDYQRGGLAAIDASPTNGLRALLAGEYEVTAIVSIAGGTAGTRGGGFAVNGTTARLSQSYSNTGASAFIEITESLILNANDVVTLVAASTATLNTIASSSGASATALTLTYIGP